MPRTPRPGGRISLAEPINRDYVQLSRAHKDEFYGYGVPEIAHLVERLNADDQDERDDDPMMDFNHVDLVEYAECAGFHDVHLELHIDVAERQPRDWDAFMKLAPNPNANDRRNGATLSDRGRASPARRTPSPVGRTRARRGPHSHGVPLGRQVNPPTC